MDKKIIVRILLPLSLLASICFIISFLFPWNGLFINLTTELFSIIITIGYVNFILDKRETENWKKVDIKVSEELRITINKIITTVRTSFNIGIQDYLFFNANSYDINKMNESVIAFCKDILEPNIQNKIEQLNQNSWKTFINQIINLHKEIDRLLTIFNMKLNPSQYELLMIIQKSLMGIIASYETFPDIIGVSDDKLPEMNKEKAIEIRNGYNIIISRDVKEILVTCRKLSEHLHKN